MTDLNIVARTLPCHCHLLTNYPFCYEPFESLSHSAALIGCPLSPGASRPVSRVAPTEPCKARAELDS